ncbi:ATP-binding cassette subfamily B protein [Hungatella effluvii]|uniref:ATP-binding cassette subfamily B protein n=1 Tax=Hungatella effluvii TaxID=1096246 RepID=A0A2V3YCS0_9FIRM|nr:ABC transporter ATP-binding protein [Hungatella effluvii]PXX57201.1 ATP-binding cassette subfamily B protein [Hungatella effluvii]
MKKMYKELFLFKWALLLLILTVIGSVAANLALPMYLSEVINTAIPAGDKVRVVSIGGTMLLFVLLGVLCSVGTGFFASLASVGFGRNVRSRIFRKVQYYSQTEFDGFSTSSLITRTNNDVVQVQTFMNMLLKVCLMAPIMCIGGVVLALAKSVTMSMILIVSLPVMIAFVLIIARLASPLSKKMQEKLDEINLVTREKLTGIRVARAFGTEQFEEERFRRVNDEFMVNTVRMNSVMGIMIPGLSLILYATMVALIAFGGYQIINIHTAIPIGDIIAVIQYVMQIMMSVMMLSMIFVMYPRAAVSAGRINEVLDTVPVVADCDGAVTETGIKGYVSFRDVTFTFPNAESPALEHISFDSSPGEVTAVIGSTGSGKSTLINLIPRFYDVQEGEILVDGVNVKEMSLEILRGKIGLVPQKAFLFRGTIAENVGYGQEEPNQADVEHAVMTAQSYDFVTAKEGGFDAPISQGGANVSGGQRQRLAIARAIARKPEIYIFDDSFSALDYKTDAALRKALLSEAKEATVILVAQRVSTIKNADRILVLEDGRCVGQGRHEELMKSCEVYREIVYSQLTQEEAEKDEV